MIMAAGLLLTTSAFASTVTLNNQAKVDAGTYATESDAYAAGFELADSLKTMNNSDLRKTLSVWDGNNVGVNDSNVVVKAFASQPDQIQYRAIVNVDYQFDAHENNR